MVVNINNNIQAFPVVNEHQALEEGQENKARKQDNKSLNVNVSAILKENCLSEETLQNLKEQGMKFDQKNVEENMQLIEHTSNHQEFDELIKQFVMVKVSEILKENSLPEKTIQNLNDKVEKYAQKMGEDSIQLFEHLSNHQELDEIIEQFVMVKEKIGKHKTSPFQTPNEVIANLMREWDCAMNVIFTLTHGLSDETGQQKRLLFRNALEDLYPLQARIVKIDLSNLNQNEIQWIQNAKSKVNVLIEKLWIEYEEQPSPEVERLGNAILLAAILFLIAI